MTMDIEGILANQSAELLDIDLHSLEVELETGGYDSTYIARCRQSIGLIRKQRNLALLKQMPGETKAAPNPPLSRSPLTVSSESLSPFGKPDSSLRELSDSEKFQRDLELIRQANNPMAEFKSYFKKNPSKDESFIDANFSIFQSDELSILLECFDFSEGFLEKYFGVLDHGVIAKKQHFSEEFFMKHFSDLDPETVIKKGVNEWRSKSERSSKLDVFLRLKGFRF